MACSSPAALLVYKRPEDDKFQKQFVPNVFPDEIETKTTFLYQREQFLRKGWIANIYSVGCGSCHSCRMRYSREWANRCVLESMCYDKSNSYFVTLTYADEFLPYSEKTGIPTLNWDDHKNYNKRLRRYVEYHQGLQGIRFYTAGEYGDLNGRPHFHQLIFNIDIPDKEYLATNKFGDILYTSKMITDLWGKGIVVIGALNWNTAAYTARYVMKKQKGFDSIIYSINDIEKPDTRMSTRPGIAVPWFDQYGGDLYHQESVDSDGFPIFHDRIILPSNGDKAMSCKPPRIFDLKAVDRGLPVDQVKEMRQRVAELMDEQRRIRVMETDRSYFTALEDIAKNSNKGMFRKFQELC